MRKLLIIIFMSICLFSCDIRDYNYKANVVYDVVYIDTTIRYDTIFNCRTLMTHKDEPVIAYSYSNRGTNWVIITPGSNFKHSTTAQIRVISYKKIEE